MDSVPPLSNRASQKSKLEILIQKQDDNETQIHTHPIGGYKNLFKLTMVISLISLSSFYFGYSLTILSTVTNSTLAYMYTSQVNNAVVKSVLTGGVPVGAIFGSLLANLLMKAFTRRNYLLVVNVCALIVNGIIQIPNLWVLLVCRLLCGIFVGLYMGIVPIYIHQLCPKSVAGSFGAFTQLAHIIGVVICYLIGLIFYLVQNQSQFVIRFQLQFTSIIIIFQTFFLLINYVPQSPNSLIQKKNIKKAKQVLGLFHPQEDVGQALKERQLENQDVDPDDTIQIRQSLNVDIVRLTWKSALIGFQLPFMQQMSGVNFLVTQVGSITGQFDVGLQPYSALFINTIQFIATALSVLVLVRVGRKPLIQYGNLGIGILFFAIDTWQPAFPLTIVFMCLFMIWFGLTIGPVVWLYVPEILPTKVVPIATVTFWIGCSISVIVLPIITSAMGNNPYLVFIILGGIQLLFFIPNVLFVVQTKGLPIYQINAKFK